MRLLRRLGGVVALLFSLIGTVACVAGIVCVWMFYQRVAERAEAISARLDIGLERVSNAIGNVRRAVDRARTDVAEVRKESADVDRGGAKGRLASRTLRTLIQQKAAPDIDDLGGRLATLSDAALAVSSLLDSFHELDLAPRLRLEPEQLKRRADEAKKVSGALRRIEATMGGGSKETDAREVAEAASQVDGVLQRCLAAVDDWQSSVETTRAELGRTRERLLGWQMIAAIAVSALCLWVGAGQVSLFAHALRWCRGI
jgi:hypothetical protein